MADVEDDYSLSNNASIARRIMANVTDSNFWRPNPLSDLPREATDSPPRVPLDFQADNASRNAQ